MTKARRSTASKHDQSHRRRRTMAFESLDARTVLSAGSFLSAPWLPEVNRFDGRIPLVEPTSAEYLRQPVHGLTSGYDGTTLRTFGDGSGLQAFGNRGPAPLDNFGPRPRDYSPPLVVNSWSADAGSTIVVLPPGGWSGLSARDVVTTLLLIDLLSQSTPAPPPEGGAFQSLGSQAPPPDNLGSALPSSLGAPRIGSPTNDLGRDRGPQLDQTLASLTSISTASVDTPSTASQSNARSIAADDAASAVAYLSQSRTADKPTSDGSADDLSGNSLFGDGGWVELTPRDAQLPHWRSPKVDEKVSTPTRRLREFADDAFWDDVLEGLEELLDDSEDETPTTNPRKPSRSARNDLQRVEPIDSPITYPAARYDEGGMIALDASGNHAVDAIPAMADAAPNVDAAPITFEAGVALFQVFEWSEPEVAPAAESAEEALPEGDRAQKPTDLPAEPVEQVAAGVGLGLLFSGPILRGRKRADERQIRLRKVR